MMMKMTGVQHLEIEAGLEAGVTNQERDRDFMTITWYFFNTTTEQGEFGLAPWGAKEVYEKHVLFQGCKVIGKRRGVQCG
jgi:hypothetical protein